MFALTIQGDLELIQLDHQCAPELATEDLPFVSIGIGQPHADPFLAFLRRVFWPDRLPKVSEGTLAATWTIYHAIQVSPGGVAGPMQMMILTKDGVRELDQDELDEHRQMADEAEKYLGKYTCLAAEPGTPVPHSPPLPEPRSPAARRPS
jgi:hypothetical protein